MMQLNRRSFIESLSLFLTSPNFGLGLINSHDLILKEVPEAKPYIDFINECRLKHAITFDVPLEVLIYHFHLESKYNPLAISSRLAVGIAQFMGKTAKDMGLKVYDNKELNFLEQRIESNFSKLRTLENGDEESRGFRTLFYNNDFKEAIRLKRNYDALRAENELLIKNFRKQFLYYAKDQDFDHRTNPHESIETGTKFLIRCCYDAEVKFGGRREHNIIRGLAVYNYGPKALDDGGLPNAKETIKHIRGVMAFTDKVYSQSI
ncbi:MAG: transglycosylase SLT domain-containing protein [Nanoarchaeota archaeon]